MNKLIEEYATLKMQEKQTKERITEIQDEVTKIIIAEGGKIELPYGNSVSLRVIKDWQYPQYLTAKVDSLKSEASKLQKQWQIRNEKKFEGKPFAKFNEAKY